MSHSDKYHFFWGGVFSQWFKCEFTFNGIEFAAAEQAMMYHKAKLFDDLEIADSILQTRDPEKQKSLGRRVKSFDEITWDAHKYELVREINYAKFAQNKGLRRKLFQVQDRNFVEASPVDFVWGIGLSEEKALELSVDTWPGQNLLGKAITSVRDQLRAEHPEEFEQCSKMEIENA